MITFALGLTFIGFFLAYNTSKRAQPINGTLREWARKYPKNTNALGLVLLVSGVLITIFALGWGAGIFSYLVALMLFASFTVLISPLKFFSIRVIAIIATIFLLIEINLP